MKYVLTLDIESKDDELKSMGPGWATDIFELICVGYKINNDPTIIIDKYEMLEELIKGAHTIVCHNAQYDLGAMASMFPWLLKSDITFVDTIIFAKLHNNTENGYSLNELSGKYLRRAKLNSSLGDSVLKHKLINCKDHTTKLSKTKAENYSKSHLKELYEVDPEAVKMYCKMDVDLCKGLYDFYLPHMNKEHVTRFSDLLKLMIKSRLRGVKVNSEKLYDIKSKLNKKRDKVLAELIELSGNTEFNPLSTADIAQVLLKERMNLPRTEKGNISIVSKWLEEQEHPICKKIVEYRVLEKLARDFCDNILTMQSKLPEPKKGYIYPTFNILGADTGRFSCKSPNLQQVPSAKKHAEIGALIRDAYEADEGKFIAEIDYSAQEPRLQVHYASLINAEGAELLVEEYKKDPNMDLHGMVSKLTGVSRNEAKTINLGLCLSGHTLVFTENGLKKLKDIEITDRVFDGDAYVFHSGIVYNGDKEVIWKNQVGLTSDHGVLTESSWQEWKEVVIKPSLSQSALSLAKSKLLDSLNIQDLMDDLGIGTLKENVRAEDVEITTQKIYKKLKTQNANIVFDIGDETTLGKDLKIEYMQQKVGAITQKIRTMQIMEDEESLFLKSLEQTIMNLLTIYKHSTDMITLNSTWTGSITIKDIVEVILDLSLAEKICEIDEPYRNYKEKIPVYDIVDAGPQNRFMILTANGPLIVHNCYGMGVTKLSTSLKLSVTQAKELLNQFHLKLPYLKELNDKCKSNLKKNKGIRSIGGRWLRLDKPWINPEDGAEKTFEYKALNKLIQSSAADQMILALLELDKQGFDVIFSIHDAAVLQVSSVAEGLRAKKIMEEVLQLRVPVVAELKIGTTWGNGKVVTEDDSKVEVKING